MNRWKKAERLSYYIVKLSKGKVSRDEADLAAYRYFARKSFWDMIKPNHHSLSQIANSYLIGSRTNEYKERLSPTINSVVNTEAHAELIRGKLVVTDWTSPAHNDAVTAIAGSIKKFIKEGKGEGVVTINSVGLYCCELCDDDSSFFLPDVMVVL